jgi:hypothetical protein
MVAHRSADAPGEALLLKSKMPEEIAYAHEQDLAIDRNHDSLRC